MEKRVSTLRTGTVDDPDFDPSRWVDEYGDALYRYAVVRLRDGTKAEDVVQETMLAALRGYANFAGRSSLRTWLFGILKHKIIDQLREDARRADTADSTAGAADLTDFFDSHGHYAAPPKRWQRTPEREVEREELRACLQACLDALSPRLARVFSLRELDGLEREEICKILEISSTNYWVMLHRARLTLRACLERSWFAPGERKGR